MLKRRSHSEARTRFANCLDDLRLIALQLFFAQGAVGGLEGDAEQQRILVRGALGVAEDLAGTPVDELGQMQSVERLVDPFPRDALIENKGEVAADGLEARELTRGGLAQRQLVEAVDVDFAEQDCSLSLRAAASVGCNWPNQPAVVPSATMRAERQGWSHVGVRPASGGKRSK